MEGRAAGIHLLLITQRPDVQAVPGNLRDQLGNRLCLRVQRSDGSKMILNAQGGERLLGRGHIAAAFPGERPPGNAAFYVGQVPFAEPEDFAVLGKAAVAHWRSQS
jgi:S-DNA-T family DNA segregation ATPase FtsK/SpoIIIE